LIITTLKSLNEEEISKKNVANSMLDLVPTKSDEFDRQSAETG